MFTLPTGDIDFTYHALAKPCFVIRFGDFADELMAAARGGSAGGYLSAMLGVSAGIPELEDLSLGNPDQPCHIQAVVDWYDPTDFLKMAEQLTASGLAPLPGTEHSGENSPESWLLGAKLADVPGLVKAANPDTYIRQNAAPFLIQHGTGRSRRTRPAIHRPGREPQAHLRRGSGDPGAVRRL